MHNQVIRHAVLVMLGIFGALMLFQFVYPSNRTLPFVKVANISVGGKSIDAAASQLDKIYATSSMDVRTQDKSFKTTLDEAGISAETTATVRQAAHYSWLQRIIPFSSIFIMANRNESMQVRYDDDRLKYFAQQVSKDGFVPAKNASIAIKNNKAELVSSRPSKIYATTSIMKAIKKTEFTPHSTVQLKPVIQSAERTNDEVKGVLGQAQKAVDTSLTLAVNNEKIVVDRPTIASWLDFPEDPKTKKLQLGLKSDVVKQYLQGIQGKVYKAPGVTKVQIIDGVEVGRTVGANGQGVDVDKSIALLNDALHAGKEATITVPIAQLAPTISYDRQYSNSSAGLTALLNAIGGSKGMGIAVMDLASGRNGTTNGSKQFEAASTYKLFVAYAVFQQMQAGTMHWSDVIDGGRTADVCFDAMIVKSDNPCAQAFAKKIGWANIQTQMRGLGLSGTNLTGSTLLTTANDLALYLYKLNSGSLLSADDTNRLIDAMKRQIYRSGIPAGTKLPVADKVGFVDNVIHDAGIVYGPRGPYIMVVMTSNSSWSAIADAASQINAFLNR